MKKIFLIFICFSSIFVSCSKKSPVVESTNTPVVETAPSQSLSLSKGETSSTTSITTSNKIDLDLTKMSATMIYSTIFDMLIMPEDYVERNIKLKGWFETYTDPNSGEVYYAVVVPDATACCQQGIEFVWPGEHTYPADFPNPGDDITITGHYKLEEIEGITYTYLEANSVEF